MPELMIKLNKNVGYRTSHLIGSTITIECDSNNIPLDAFWRKRLVDSTTDGCIEVVDGKKSSKKVAKDLS